MLKKIYFYYNIILIILLYEKANLFFPNLVLRQKLISLLTDDQDKYTPEKFNSSNSLILFNLYDQFNKYFDINTSDQNTKECRDLIFNELVLDYNYTNLFFYSGHKFTEIGYPEECISKNATFLLTLLTFDLNENSTNEEDQMTYFNSKSKSNMGFCVWKKCNNFIENNLIKNIDEKLKKNLKKNYKIKDIKIIWKHSEINEVFSTGIKVVGIILLIYISLYILVKLIIWIYTKYKESKQSEKRKRKDYLIIEESRIIKEEENEDEDSFEDISDIKNEVKNNKNKSKEEENDKEENNEEEKEKEENEEEEEEEEDDEDQMPKVDIFKKNVEESKIRYIEKNLKKAGVNISLNNSSFDDGGSDKKKISLLNNNLDEQRNKLVGCVGYINKFNDSFLQYMGLQTMTDNENKIYTNKGLEMITGLRVIFIFLITMNIIFNSFQQSPFVKLITNNFLSNFLFILIKFSSYGFFLWIFLDGFVYTFKLMHFVQKDRSFKRFLKFGCNLLPKIFCYLIIFYVVYYMKKDIGKIFVNSSIVFQQYVENEFNKNCTSNFGYLLFPFVNPGANNYTVSNNYFNNCYQFSYLFINEFYCVLITIILFYFLYRYKSKILEIVIGIIILINFIGLNLLPYFFENVYKEKYYLLKYIIGETFSIRYPHSMFNTFCIGIVCGLIYYYHYYSLNDLNSFMSEEYLPFSFLSKLMQYVNKCNIFIKITLIIISIAIIILDGLLFFIMKNRGGKNKILFEFSTALKLFYIYETPIIIIFSSILLIFLLFAEDKFQIKSFFGSRIFYTVEKTSFCYICWIQMINLLYLSASYNHGDAWSFIAILYITCYEFTVGFLVSFICTLFFELPLKIISNNIRGKDMK